MQNKKLQKIIAVTGVIGSIVTAKSLTVHATTVNTGGVSVRAANKGQVINVESTLRVRESASTSSNVIGSMKNGATFDIISKSGNWYEIAYNGIKGYVYGDYVKELTMVSSDEISQGKVQNVSTNLRVRSGASTSSSVMGYLVNNTTVSIVATEGDWYKIKYENTYGYVHKDYILVSGSENSSNNNSSNNTIEVNKTGYVYNVSSGGLRVRQEPSTSSNVLGTLYKNNSVNIIGESGSWYKIKYNNSSAYVHKDYITETNPSSNNNQGSNNSSTESNTPNVSNQKGQVTNVTTNLRVRKSPTSDSVVLGYLLNNEIVDIISKEGNWYKINFKGSIGYASADYIKLDIDNNTNGSVSDKYEIVLNELKKHIGTPYVWGGSGEEITAASIQNLKERFPQHAAEGKYTFVEQFIDKGLRAFDCSGFMQWGFSKAGISIGRTTYDQINAGVEVNLNSVKPGDLLFAKDLGHVGMYVGNDQWIESPNTGKTIRIVNVPWSTIGRARRVL